MGEVPRGLLPLHNNGGIYDRDIKMLKFIDLPVREGQMKQNLHCFYIGVQCVNKCKINIS